MHKYFSNEIVFRGHPDKVCDQISAAILKACMEQDKNTRAGIEVAGGKRKIFVTGEVMTRAKIKVKKIVKDVLRDVGYPTNCEVINNLGYQSPDIAMGVDLGGAGDQGMMFGYACNETKKYLPKAMVILQEFAKTYDVLRKTHPRSFRPDGKAQITGVYDKDFRLVEIKTFLVSYQNYERERNTTDAIIRNKIKTICERYEVPVKEILINPTGRFYYGGFDADAGLTGRKIVVDAYQSFANVGGGCMNGKDPSKVDFSATHKARQLAVRFLKKYELKWCEVQLSYAIGKAEPLAIYVDSDKGNIEVPEKVYRECTPRQIIRNLGLKHVDYVELAKYGHFTDAE